MVGRGGGNTGWWVVRAPGSGYTGWWVVGGGYTRLVGGGIIPCKHETYHFFHPGMTLFDTFQDQDVSFGAA